MCVFTVEMIPVLPYTAWLFTESTICLKLLISLYSMYLKPGGRGPARHDKKDKD